MSHQKIDIFVSYRHYSFLNWDPKRTVCILTVILLFRLFDISQIRYYILLSFYILNHFFHFVPLKKRNPNSNLTALYL